MAATVDMTKGKPAPVMIRFAVPILLGSMVEMIHITLDGIVLGRFIGVNAFAAVGATGFVYWSVLCLQIGMVSAFGSVFARRYGAKDPKGLDSAVAASFWIILLFGGILSIGGLIGSGPLLRLLDTPAELLRDAEIYLRIRFASMPIIFFGGTFSQLFYAAGNSRTPFIAYAISVVINVILSLTVVLTTDWGIFGVALVTTFAQLFSGLFCLFHLRKNGILRFSKRDLKPDFNEIKEMLIFGLPLGLRDLPAAVVALIVLRQVNGYGAAFTAGVAAAKQLYCILFPVGAALCDAMGTFVGQNFGAGDNERTELGFRTTVKMLLVSVAVIILVMFPLRGLAISLFITGEGDIAAMAPVVGVQQLVVILLFLPTYYVATAYRMYFKSIGNGFWPLVSGFAEAAARLAVILILPGLVGVWGLYFAEVCGWPVMVLLLLLAKRMGKKGVAV